MPFKLGRKIYYGWYIAVALAISETVSYGVIYYSFQVFITSMEAELGWSRSQVSAGTSISLFVMALMAYPIGWWVDKYGARLLMTVGSIAATFLLIGWSQVTDVWTYYGIWVGLGVCGSMVFYEPAFAVIAVWFNQRRSAALTLVTLAAGFASTIFLPLADYLLHNFGWRESVFMLAILLGVITIPLHALMLRRHPEDLGILPDGVLEKPKTSDSPPLQLPVSAALKSQFFWLLTLSFLVAGFGASALRVHFIPYLTSVGVASTTAAFAAGSIGVMQVVGRLIFVPLDAHMSGRLMLAGLFFMQAVAIVAILTDSALLGVVIFVAFFGASIGMRTLVRPSILADTYGSASYGRISSVMALPMTLSATAAPLVAGIMFDYFENYTMLIILTLVLSVLAGLLMLVTTRNNRKVNATALP